MKFDEYEWAIGEMLNDKDYVYNSLTKDLYFLGKVLDRKYRILRNTYTVFMVGIVISVLAFALSFNSQAHDAEASHTQSRLFKTELYTVNKVSNFA